MALHKYLLLALMLMTGYGEALAESASHVHDATPAQKKISLTLFPERTPGPGDAVRVIAKLSWGAGENPLTADELKTVHTEKFHLLVVDPTLTDYHHIHPKPTATPGNYLFTFSPKLKGGYRAWADITLLENGEQQFVMADLDTPDDAAIIPTEQTTATVNGYTFTLDCKPQSGSTRIIAETAIMCIVSVTDSSGAPFARLQPVMGAFAHLVVFYDDYKTVMHAHPMDEKSKASEALGGPSLQFHLKPEKPGFVKLFVQVRIDETDVFAPFGIIVHSAE